MRTKKEVVDAIAILEHEIEELEELENCRHYADRLKAQVRWLRWVVDTKKEKPIL